MGFTPPFAASAEDPPGDVGDVTVDEAEGINVDVADEGGGGEEATLPTGTGD